MDKFSPEKRSQIMKRIRGKNTKPELIMRKALYSLGLRYRLHAAKLPGKPDIIFTHGKVAVFVDGDWWHGRHFDKERSRYAQFWKDKIAANIKRDQRVNGLLQGMGWKIVRVWQKDLSKDPMSHAQQVKDILESRLQALR